MSCTNKWLHIGSKRYLAVRLAVCCMNCKHCVSHTPCDDPTEYACALLSRPKHEPRMVFGPGSTTYQKRVSESHLWWAHNKVSAGTVCDDYIPSNQPQMIEYEDDYTREAATGGDIGMIG